MDRILGRGAVRAAAVVFAAVVLLFASKPGEAAGYGLAFSGTVQATTGTGGGVFQALGIVPGDPVSGTLSLDPFNTDVYTGNGLVTAFDQSSTAFTFHLEHPGTVDLTYSGSGSGQVLSAGSPAPINGLLFSLLGAGSLLEVRFETDPTGGPLTSLAGLPTNPAALIAMLGGASPRAVGTFQLTGYGSVVFDIDFSATAVTPIPAALPLFASALGGLGFLGWRRRGATAKMPC